jgi:hypothetical protein
VPGAPGCVFDDEISRSMKFESISSRDLGNVYDKNC